MSSEAEKVLKSMNKVVAENIDTSHEVVATHLWRRIGVDMLRGNCRAFHRRVGRGGWGVAGGGSAMGLVVQGGV